jgi:cytoskeletal protein RodZ
LPVILLLLWIVIGILRFWVDWMVEQQRLTTARTHSLQHATLQTQQQQNDDRLGDDDSDEKASRDSASSTIGNRRKCCYGYLIRPSIELILLHTSLFSYSSIVKTTM